MLVRLVANDLYALPLGKLQEHVPTPALMHSAPSVDVRLKLSTLVYGNFFKSRISCAHDALAKVVEAVVEMLVIKGPSLDATPNCHLEDTVRG